MNIQTVSWAIVLKRVGFTIAGRKSTAKEKVVKPNYIIHVLLRPLLFCSSITPQRAPHESRRVVVWYRSILVLRPLVKPKPYPQEVIERNTTTTKKSQCGRNRSTNSWISEINETVPIHSEDDRRNRWKGTSGVVSAICKDNCWNYDKQPRQRIPRADETVKTPKLHSVNEWPP